MNGKRVGGGGHQVVLIGSTIVACWLGMQQVHEAGHVVGAWLTGGRMERVVLHPLSISRTDLSENPQPLFVAWAGPVAGVLVPLAAWGVVLGVRLPFAFLLRFFAAFCLVANGSYIALGSFAEVGDCGEMMRHGSSAWHLWLFGAICVPLGLAVWHGLGPRFGLGRAKGEVSAKAAWLMLAVAGALVGVGILVRDG
jgi:hypothetical protein